MRVWVLFLMVVMGQATLAQAMPVTRYDIGQPDLVRLYVRLDGDDTRDGTTPQTALRTIRAAWQRIPMNETLTQGYHILVGAGQYLPEDAPNYWESRHGTAQHPILIEAEQGTGTAFLPNINAYDLRYTYFIALNIETDADPFHCEACDHILLRGNVLKGANPETYNTQETLKINQSQYIYLEDNDISGAWDNAIDLVAVQYGHILYNRIHNAGDWCAYAKGGSAFITVAYNTIFNCGTGGFTAGQGTGFQFMTAPFLQYEAYDIAFSHNFVYDTQGAGVGVQGGYNIRIDSNLFYRVGARSHLMEFVFGMRSCDGEAGDSERERCASYQAAGGWGNSVVADGNNFVRIPNKNVYVYNNVVYNPAPYRSEYQHFAIFAPYDGEYQADSGVPLPARADENLRIVNNLIWNGDANMPLGIEGGDWEGGCKDDNLVCNVAQLRQENTINTQEPLFDLPSGQFETLELPLAPVPVPAFE